MTSTLADPTVEDVPVSPFAVAHRRRRAPGVAVPGHGTHRRYKYWGCRCSDCREAYRIYKKRMLAGLNDKSYQPALRSVRQLQALAWMGFDNKALSIACGLSVRRTGEIIHQKSIGAWGLHRDTVAKIDEAYDRLIWEKPTKNNQTEAIRRRARAQGFQPPEAWTDETIGDPAAKPFDWQGDDYVPDDEYVDPVEIDRLVRLIERYPMSKKFRQPALWGPLNRAERVALLYRLSVKGMPFNQIAMNVGARPESIRQWVSKRNIAAVFVQRTPAAGRFVALGQQWHIEFSTNVNALGQVAA